MDTSPPPPDASALTLEQKIKRLQGPILVLGGSGFIGANLLRALLQHREDVYGTAMRLPAWRLEGLAAGGGEEGGVLGGLDPDHLLGETQPPEVFYFVSVGAALVWT